MLLLDSKFAYVSTLLPLRLCRCAKTILVGHGNRHAQFNMPTIGKRIRAARERAGLSQDELARRVGVSRAAVGTWERDEKEPRKAIAQRLMSVLSLSASAFNRFGSGGVALAPQAQLSTITQLEWSDIPLIAAGLPPVGAKTVHVEITPVNPLVENEYRLVVTDDSMSPDINPGDVIAYEAHTHPADGDLVIAHVNGDPLGILRNYRKRGNGAFDLWPINPNFPTVTHNASTHITIVGVVVRHLRFLRPAVNGNLST